MTTRVTRARIDTSVCFPDDPCISLCFWRIYTKLKCQSELVAPNLDLNMSFLRHASLSRTLFALYNSQKGPIIIKSLRFYSPGPQLPPGWTPASLSRAQEWIRSFQRSREIDKKLVEVSFSRSSGPGGQHVNKTNSKATVKLPVQSSLIPDWIRGRMRSLPFYVASSDALQVSSMTHREQIKNLDECLKKLHSTILNIAMETIPKPPSEEQQKRVQSLERKESAARRVEKAKRTAIKRERSRKWDD